MRVNIRTGANINLEKTTTNEGKNPVDKVDAESDEFNFDTVLKLPELSSPARQFVESLQAFYELHGYLTARQAEQWVKIEQEYSPENIRARHTWRATYGTDDREIAIICAHYYSATLGEGAPYFTELAQRVLSEPDFIPSEKQWRAMCTNKYAQRVLEATKAPPKYPPGSLVQFRQNERPLNVTLGEAVNGGIVLETNVAPVTRAAKGSKKYLVLLMGGSTPFIVEERRLKKLTRRKNK